MPQQNIQNEQAKNSTTKLSYISKSLLNLTSRTKKAQITKRKQEVRLDLKMANVTLPARRQTENIKKPTREDT